MNIIILYESIYGSTEKYARWLSEALSCDLSKSTKFTSERLKEYDTVIFGGGLYAGGVTGIKFLSAHEKELCNKNLILFTCGIADPAEAISIEHIQKSLRRSLPPKQQAQVQVFFLRGGIDYSKLSVPHKCMMAMLRKMIKKKDPATLGVEDREILETYGKAIDFTDPKNIGPIVDYVMTLKTGPLSFPANPLKNPGRSCKIEK